MKKRLLFLILTAFVVMSALPALAASPADLNALARYFPASTPLLISVRTDDDFLATINGLAETIAARFPNADMDQSLQEALDEMVQQLYPDGDFQTTVRSWLGDTVSVGVLSFEKAFDSDSPGSDGDDVPALIAVSITDQAAALDFVINALNQDRTPFFQTTGDGYTLLVVGKRAMPASLNEADLIIVRDDVLLFSANTDTSLVAASGLQSPNLLDQPEFSAALGWLPASDYSVTVYADMIADMLNMAAAMDSEAAASMGALASMGINMAALGPQVFGFTILGDSTLTFDIAQALDPASMPAMVALPGPLDPAFAAHIPAGTPLALHGTDLKGQLEAAAGSYSLLFESLAAQPGVDADEIEAARAQIQEQLLKINELFTTFTDLDFSEDVLSWLDGDFVAFISFNPNMDASDSMALLKTFPLELGLGIEATDPAKAQAAVEGFTQALNQLAELANTSMSKGPGRPTGEVTVTSEELNGTPVTVVTLVTRKLSWPVELLLGANDSVFALGTRGAVSAIFAADGGLPSNARFQAAQAHMLPNASAFAWLNTEGLLPLADLARGFLSGPGEEADLANLNALLNLIHSGTITSAYDAENNIALARFTLTLAAE